MAYEIQQTRADAEKAAQIKGCVCRVPKANELFLDIDSADALEAFFKLFASFKATEDEAEYELTPSPSGRPGRYHVVVDLGRPVNSPLERITLQAVLGSDPMRELLNWRRLVAGVPHDANNILFELPAGAE
jgi:hypothetical protein